MNLFGLGRTKKCNRTSLSLLFEIQYEENKDFSVMFYFFFPSWVDEHPLLSYSFSQNNRGTKGISVIYYTCISPLD